MKKMFFIASLSVSALAANAQNWQGPSPMGTYSTDGGLMTFRGWNQRTTIGASWGGANALSGTGYIGFNIAQDGPNLTNLWSYLGVNNVNGGNAIIGAESGEMLFVCKPNTGGGGGTLTNNDIRANIRMRITGDGRMIIGPSYVADALTTPGSYKLYVEGGILTEHVKVSVKNAADWSDFVFDEGYKMMPLPALKQYIQENKHLPSVPSTKEVMANGVDLQQMDARLLQKVEELTLHQIAQQEEIEQLKTALAKKGND